MDPGLALSAVEYAIQLAQYIKHTVKAYHENPTKYENLLSRFRTIRKSLRVIRDSNNVDFQSPIWGRAFRRIRKEFEEVSATLEGIHHAIRSSSLKRIIQAKQTTQKLSALTEKIGILQRDLDLLGFFTFSNAATAHQSEVVIHNVQDVKESMLALEARLQSMEQKLAAQNSNTQNRDRSLPLEEQNVNLDFDSDVIHQIQAQHREVVTGLYQRELEQPRRHGVIMESISALQARLQKRAANVIETHFSEEKSTLLSEVCEKLLDQWNLDHVDVRFLPNNRIHQSDRSIICEGSMTIRDMWHYPLREAAVAVKIVTNVERDGPLETVLQRIVTLREINHPNILAFYGACWPGRKNGKKRKTFQDKSSTKYMLFVTERMTHNLARAIESPALSRNDVRLTVLADVARGVEYLHCRGIFRVALSVRHVLLRIVGNEVVGRAKLCSLLSSCENMRRERESLFKPAAELRSRAPLFHQDVFNFGILMCYVLSSRIDHSKWDDGVFARLDSTNTNTNVTELARSWVKGIEPPFLKELAKRCLLNDKESRPSFKFIRACLEGFSNAGSLPDLSTPDCGEEIRVTGKVLFHGKPGNPNNMEKAVAYFDRAVSCGNVTALVNLGNCHFYGLGTKRDVELGLKLFRVAAYEGNAAGQVKLGACYQVGIKGTLIQDVAAAAEMYRRAAIQGNASAQFKLACYKYNDEVGNPRRLEEAAVLWELAAFEGHRAAQFYIGRCFEKGNGLQQDFSIARMWYSRAAARGHFGGKWALQQLPNTVNAKPAEVKGQSVPELFS